MHDSTTLYPLGRPRYILDSLLFPHSTLMRLFSYLFRACLTLLLHRLQKVGKKIKSTHSCEQFMFYGLYRSNTTGPNSWEEYHKPFIIFVLHLIDCHPSSRKKQKTKQNKICIIMLMSVFVWPICRQSRNPKPSR